MFVIRSAHVDQCRGFHLLRYYGSLGS